MQEYQLLAKDGQLVTTTVSVRLQCLFNIGHRSAYKWKRTNIYTSQGQNSKGDLKHSAVRATYLFLKGGNRGPCFFILLCKLLCESFLTKKECIHINNKNTIYTQLSRIIKLGKTFTKQPPCWPSLAQQISQQDWPTQQSHDPTEGGAQWGWRRGRTGRTSIIKVSGLSRPVKMCWWGECRSGHSLETPALKSHPWEIFHREIPLHYCPGMCWQLVAVFIASYRPLLKFQGSTTCRAGSYQNCLSYIQPHCPCVHTSPLSCLLFMEYFSNNLCLLGLPSWTIYIWIDYLIAYAMRRQCISDLFSQEREGDTLCQAGPFTHKVTFAL